MTSQPSPILIAGAGPVGLFCAVMLVRAGVPVIVLEQNDDLAQDMRASTFHPATLDLLTPYGLDQPLVSRGSITPRWQYLVHGTGQQAIFDLDVISDLTAHPYRLQCEQFHFTELALEYLHEQAGFEIRFGHAVTSCRQDEHRVEVMVDHDGEQYVLKSPWLIAADGGSSGVRKSLGLSFEGSIFPKTSITLVINVPLEQDYPELQGVNYVWTDSGHYSLMQIRDLWRFTYSPGAGQTVAEALDDQSVQAALQSVFPRSEPYRLLQKNHYTLHQRSLERFREGRVLFAGDSAHLNSPAGGMGMNGGMHDARCLVDHMLPVLEGGDAALLDRYSRRRLTIAREEVQRLSARNYRWHRETDPARRREIWDELTAITGDRSRMRDFLLNASMIRSRQREQEID